MRFILAAMLVCTLVGVAGAIDQPFSNVAPSKALYQGDGASDGREGGESWNTALPIGGLPYTDTGATCDNLNDIVPACLGSTAPDVVYSYTPSTNQTINVSLCGSGYDTGLAIYDAAHNELYCNDDFCGLQSEIDNVPVTAGQTYYFVVDGYSSGCGSYVINVIAAPGPCDLVCPQGALQENEPPCGDNYYDATNGGCNSTGWTLMCPQDGAHAVMCGTSGTYLYYGMSYRDTDWIQVYGTGGTMTATLETEFLGMMIFIYGADCNNLLYDLAYTNPCVPTTLSRTVGLGVSAWMWVGPQVFSGVPCGSEWILTMDGIFCPTQSHVCCVGENCFIVLEDECAAMGGTFHPEWDSCGPPNPCQHVPATPDTWGGVKSLYR
jgi:hypothetical protein